MNQKRVVVAMSGGVDSSVAAALLKKQGYDVVGVTMNLYSLPKDYCMSENLKSCCGWKATEDAHQVAITLGISHYVVDLRKPFEKSVITDFCEEYAQGRTPNPCVRCNQYIKFDVLLKKMKALEADYLATGHHARIEYDRQNARYILKKGKDRKKDQSYFLYAMTQKQLSRTLMPVGDYTKEEVRKKAQSFGFLVAERPESQEICFVPDNDYAGFLLNRIPEAFHPGPVVDSGNRTLARHKGIVHYTIGQRRGMGISAPHPLYVLSILSDKKTIVVGPEKELYGKSLLASALNTISLEKITEPLKVKARIRYKHKEAQALVTLMHSDKVRVEFEKPQRAITPGQSVVFYDGDTVVGGGIIDQAE